MICKWPLPYLTSFKFLTLILLYSGNTDAQVAFNSNYFEKNLGSNQYCFRLIDELQTLELSEKENGTYQGLIYNFIYSYDDETYYNEIILLNPKEVEKGINYLKNSSIDKIKGADYWKDQDLMALFFDGTSQEFQLTKGDSTAFHYYNNLHLQKDTVADKGIIMPIYKELNEKFKLDSCHSAFMKTLDEGRYKGESYYEILRPFDGEYAPLDSTHFNQITTDSIGNVIQLSSTRFKKNAGFHLKTTVSGSVTESGWYKRGKRSGWWMIEGEKVFYRRGKVVPTQDS